jgi:hypothetical protein
MGFFCSVLGQIGVTSKHWTFVIDELAPVIPGSPGFPNKIQKAIHWNDKPLKAVTLAILKSTLADGSER